MTRSIGRPRPDCHDRRDTAAARRAALAEAAGGRGTGTTLPNGEETRYTHHDLSFHKGLPHDVDGRVDAASYHAMVRAVTGHDDGGIETLAVGDNRTGSGSGPEDPQRWTTRPSSARYRKLVSPLTGHVYETQGADAGSLAISPAPLVASDELAAEMAELYGMALLRDVPFTEIEEGSHPTVVAVVAALGGMAFFDGVPDTEHGPARARKAARGTVTSGADLFRGSTRGSKDGPWLSQFLLVGSDNTVGEVTYTRQNVMSEVTQTDEPSFRGTSALHGREDGFVTYGSQVIDQRSVVAKDGIDWMTSWPAWLDVQNGVELTGLDVFRHRRRYLTTPRDIASYVHVDQLYQGYLNACLLLLGDGFPKDRGLPESSSRTRAAFASYGGPHVLSLVTEVATRALKAVWRQKWLHHRRTRPEVVAALLTLHANEPDRITDPRLAQALGDLAAKIPADLLARVAEHNTAQNARTDEHVVPAVTDTSALPTVADATNHLLPMAFPEGSPTHPAYGAGHATVAGACVTVLKAMFEMYDEDHDLRAWPHDEVYVPRLKPGAPDAEGGELVPHPSVTGADLTVAGELDKLAANISIARNMAGVHYSTDYYESVRLGERVAASVIEEQLGMYAEPVSVSFPSFDGDRVEIVADGAVARVRVTDSDGSPLPTADWFGRYSA